MSIFDLTQGDSPLVISVPHDGALIPDEIKNTMNHEVFTSSDRDYLIDDVFDLPGLSCSKIKANYSRHVIDLNRPASGEALYQNQAETELCPTTTFDFQAIYLPGMIPDAKEIQRRINIYWQPYHQQLEQLIQSARSQFGYCLLIDAHSIDDEVPRFFKGRLPDINVGTFAGRSCGAEIERCLLGRLQQQSDFSFIANGRFKGGYITRQYGRPEQGVHAIQLEHAKSAYLNEAAQLSEKATKLRQLWLNALTDLVKSENFC